MSIVSEFKEFAMKGNVVDLAVGVIIGAAFGKIVDSLVKDLIMPIIGSTRASLPSAPCTRWQGMMIGNGFLPMASPTARDAVGSPSRLATSP